MHGEDGSKSNTWLIYFGKGGTKEYLPQLQERQKWTKIKRNFIPGDIILVVDDSHPATPGSLER